MARPKKTTDEKKTTRKPTASKKPATAKMQLLAKPTSGKQTRRPPNNPDVPQDAIDELNVMLNEIKTLLDSYSQHLRSLDRKRLNGVGIKKLGFVERAYELALENPEFLPHYLTLERFGDDIHYFINFQSLIDLTAQVREKLWNITLQSADIAYTDALEFYASVHEAAKRRVDAAETLYNDLFTFFKSHGNRNTEPTQKQEMRDAKSLIRGTKDGKFEVINVKPRLTGGKRKIIDKTFKDSESFLDTNEGTITE